jgi:hypothetical protein
MANTLEIIRQQFHFLVDEYSFSIVEELYSPDVMGNALVVFKSISTVVKVVVDRSQVLVEIGAISWAEKDLFELSDVISYFHSGIKEVYKFEEGSTENRANIESQASQLAFLLGEYCVPLLNGNFSMETKIREIESRRVESMMEHFKKLAQSHKKK